MKNLRKLSLILLLSAALLLSSCSASGSYVTNDAAKGESYMDYMEAPSKTKPPKERSFGGFSYLPNSLFRL